MRLITIYFSLLLIGLTISINAQDSPVVALETVSTSASTFVVSISATNFTNIQACDLKILYNQIHANPTGVSNGTGLGGSASVNLSTGY